MMCHRIGRLPIGTIGFGRYSVSSRKRVPCPPHKITTFIRYDIYVGVGTSVFRRSKAKVSSIGLAGTVAKVLSFSQTLISRLPNSIPGRSINKYVQSEAATDNA